MTRFKVGDRVVLRPERNWSHPPGTVTKVGGIASIFIDKSRRRVITVKHDDGKIFEHYEDVLELKGSQ